MRLLSVEIDAGAGFCGGVIRAIDTAQKRLAEGPGLYSLGAIVHNESELGRLEALGMKTVQSVDEVPCGGGCDLLIRAHGEPPATYRTAAERGISVIDCTCPVVLKLQKDIRAAAQALEASGKGGQILIFGKTGHAEVNGLVGQVGEGKAVVVENVAGLEAAVADGRIDLSAPLEVFSQTTKDPDGYALLCRRIAELGGKPSVHRTICSQVASRHSGLARFAMAHDVVIFVAGNESSNGKVLFELCREHNPATHHICSPDDIDPAWFSDMDKVGVSGATSTPKWLLEEVARKIWQLSD